MVAKLTEQRRILNKRLRRVSDDIMTINTTRPDLGGMYLNQLQPERVQLIRWHDNCTAALEEAKEYTKEELGRTGKVHVSDATHALLGDTFKVRTTAPHGVCMLVALAADTAAPVHMILAQVITHVGAALLVSVVCCAGRYSM